MFAKDVGNLMDYCLPINSVRYNLKESIALFTSWFQTIEQLGKIRHFSVSNLSFYFFTSLCCCIYTGLAVCKKLQLSASNNDSGPTQLKRQQSTPKVYFCYSLDRGNILCHTFILDFLNSNIVGVRDRKSPAAARTLRHATRGSLVLESSPQCVLY